MVWKSDEYSNSPYDLTSFDLFENEKTGEILNRILDEIEVHFTELNEIEIIGIDLNDEVQKILNEYGFNDATKTEKGLISEK
jgi:hypothetical protein